MHESPRPANILVVANPISGRGRARPAAERLAALLRTAGDQVRLEFTNRAGDARTLAAGLSADIDRIAVVGGDGTVNEVVSGLARRDVALAVLPMGTANLLATAIGARRDPDAAAKLIHRGRTVRFDVATVADRRFFAVAGVGFDAQATRRLEATRRGPINKLSYARPALHAIRHHRPTPLVVEVDGRLITENAAWVIVSNVKPYAAYFQFTPEADPTDGILDVCILNGHRRRDLLRLGLRALFRRSGRSPVASYPRGRRIRVASSGTPVPYQLDGDTVGETPLDIVIEPAALPLIVS